MKKNENNYLSLWIANLGVEPLFSILFFLFLPAFFFLKFLLHLVCIVFDAMTVSLSYLFKIILINRPVYLSIIAVIVKIFLVISPIKAYCSDKKAKNITDIFIAKGEQVEIDAKSMTHYSIGNKETLKHIYRKSAKIILIKGKSLGFSDLIVWSKNDKKTYHIYITSKKEQFNKLEIANIFSRTGLQTNIQGPLIKVDGIVKSLSEYFLIHKVIKKKYENLILDIKLDRELRNTIYGIVYKKAYALGARKVICFNFQMNIECSLQGMSIKNSIIKSLGQKYNIKFQNSIGILKDTNYVAHFKIVQLENSSGESRKLGASKISSGLMELINKNYISLIEGEKVYLSEFATNATLLAEPQTTLILNEKSKLSLGGEIPFDSQTSNNQNSLTQWKFYGLKISSTLQNLNGRPYLKFNTELTAPEGNNISGSKGMSGAYITKDKYIKLFEVGYKVNQESSEGLPLLNKIPILKYLFTANQESESFKQIICYVKVEELK